MVLKIVGISCLLFCVIATAAQSLTNVANQSNHTDEIPSSSVPSVGEAVAPEPIEKVKVSVFYETFCPDSIAFITEQLWPAYKAVEEIMAVDLIPYGKATYTPKGDTWEFQCQHGKRECQGNKIHGCVLDLSPIDKALAFIYCTMSSQNPLTASETCAYKSGVDWTTVSQCADGLNGSQVLHDNGVRTESLSPKLVFVPWILINDVFSEQQLQASLSNLLRVVCDAYKGTKPSQCPA